MEVNGGRDSVDDDALSEIDGLGRIGMNVFGTEAICTDGRDLVI